MKVNVFQFQDYRELLIALIEQRKKEKKVFSYRWFSQKAGLTSPNFLNLVVKGKRHLSSDSIEKVIKVFHLTKDEGDFFRVLVHFNKSKTLSEKEHFASQLVRFKKFLQQYPLSKDQFDYYSKWYHVPIRELLTFKEAPQSDLQLSQSLIPAISKQEAADALEQLVQLDMIEKVSGRWRAKLESVSTGHKFSSYAVVQYHQKMIALAAESLDRFPGREREVSSVTVGLSEESFHKIKKMVEDFRSQLMQIAEEDMKKERVYQMNFQLFPLSTGKGSSK